MSNTSFTLYVSGIALGKFAFSGDNILHASRLGYSADFTPFRPLTQEDDTQYACYSMLLPFDRLSRLSLYDRAVQGASESFVLGRCRYTLARPGCYTQREVKGACSLLFDESGVFAFVCPARESVAVLVRDGCEARTPVALWKTYADGPLYAIRPLGTFHVPMRDGISLATDVYLPEGANLPVPALLIRTPYDKDRGVQAHYRYVRRGYAVVVQDVRGRNESEGEFIPLTNEIEDGDDTLNWLGAQSWCDGNVGMLGGSYLGYVQWCAAALGSPYLKALVSVVPAGTAFVDLPMRGGTFACALFAWIFAMSQRRFSPERMLRNDWHEILRVRPIANIPQKAFGHEIPFLSKWLQHTVEDDFWLRGNWFKRYKGRQVPVLLQSGWFDGDGRGSSEVLELTKEYPAGLRKVILGPWPHGGNNQYDVHALSFPENALRCDLDLLYLQWFNHFLRGEENGVEQGPAIEYYTMGADEWKCAAQWPVENADDTPFYFGANGMLFPVCGGPGYTSYTYDPQNPACHVGDMSENEMEVPEDYTDEEKRSDFLCYTTPPLSAPLTVTGEADAVLYISSDVPDTDFVVRVCDVSPQGRSISVSIGVLSARFRNGFAEPEYLEPGKTVRLCVHLGKFSHCFLPGHRLRVSVTSSAEHYIFPSQNVRGGVLGQGMNIAHHTIYHGGETPSHIVLHVERTAPGKMSL